MNISKVVRPHEFLGYEPSNEVCLYSFTYYFIFTLTGGWVVA